MNISNRGVSRITNDWMRIPGTQASTQFLLSVSSAVTSGHRSFRLQK